MAQDTTNIKRIHLLVFKKQLNYSSTSTTILECDCQTGVYTIANKDTR